MFELNVTPGLGLIKSNGPALPDGQAPAVLVLHDSAWLNLQTYVTQVLQLPRSGVEFSALYGDFDAGDRPMMTKAAAAMNELYFQAAVFGDPPMLWARLARESDFLNDSEPPLALYAHVVWVIAQQGAIAELFAGACATLRDELTPGRNADGGLQALREVLAEEGGLASAAEGVAARTRLLLHYVERFSRVLKNASAVMAADAGNNVRSVVGQRLAGLHALAETSRKASAKAYSDYVDFTVEATHSAIISNFVQIGISLIGAAIPAPQIGQAVSLAMAALVAAQAAKAGVASAAGLLDKSEALKASAAAQRNAHAELMKAMYKAEADALRKTRLYNDLGGITDFAKFGTEGLAKVAIDLRTMLNVWDEMAKRLRTMAGAVTEDDMRTLNHAKIGSSLEAASTGWQEIVSSSNLFIRNSLVQYDTSNSWGQTIKQPN